jgi:hypothetical protein
VYTQTTADERVIFGHEEPPGGRRGSSIGGSDRNLPPHRTSGRTIPSEDLSQTCSEDREEHCGDARGKRGRRSEKSRSTSLAMRAWEREHGIGDLARSHVSEARLAADGSLETADPLPEHVPLLHRTPRCVLRRASRTGVLVERPPFLVDRARVRRVVDGEPRAASLGPTDTAGRIGWAWVWQRPGQHPSWPKIARSASRKNGDGTTPRRASGRQPR